ncbi:MAG: extracellular solute-binding protein [Clostridiales bacterium]|nr:extracellular solute-binding protein [Clostridiales bacterium]
MKKGIKMLAAGLALTMMVPMFAGCKKGRGGETVSGDDAWYNLNKIELEQTADPNDFDYVSSNYLCTLDDGYAFRKSGSLKIPDGVDVESVDQADYYVDELEIYNTAGNLVNSFDLRALVSGIDGDYVSVSQLVRTEDGFTAIVSAYNYNTQSSVSYTAQIDLASGTMSAPSASADSNDRVGELTSQGATDEGSVKLGSYTLHKIWFSASATGSIATYVILAENDDGTVTEFDMRSLFPNLEVFNISSMIDMGDNQILLLATSSDSDLVFTIDLNSGSMSQDNGDWAWLREKNYMIRQVDGAGSVVRDDDGIYSIDFTNKTFTPLFLYTSSNVNAYEIANLVPIYVTSDRALFSGTQYNPVPGTMNTGIPMIYEFTRADSNPNAGKTILDVACIGNLSYPLCQAVCNFNGTNADYFLRFDMSYQIEVDYSKGDSSENEDNAAITLGNQLAMDIMSGTGPDLIINGSKFGMINNSEYLLNLSDFVSENCSADSYYTNILDSAKIGGELFQVPLCFGVQGIVTDASNVEPGQTGFTFDQYQSFVEGPCNGNAPINQGRMYFFLNSLNCMTDLMNEDQIVNYNNEAFRTLAEFTANNVNEVMPSEDDFAYMDDDPVASMVTITNAASYFNYTKNGQRVVLGIPSYDGRGPVIISSDSVAISAQTVAPDACKEFVSILFGEEIQTLYGYQSGIPLSRSAFDTVGSKYVQSQNDDLDRNLRLYSEAEMVLYGMNTERMDESAVDDLAALIDSLTGWYVNDGSINAIIREEMPAYFEGQKTLEQIIPVLEDRVQTVINERR